MKDHHHRWPMMQEAGEDSGAAGAGAAPPPAGDDKGAGQADGAGAAEGLPTAEEWAAAKAQLAELKAGKEAAAAAAEAARQEALTEQQKMAEAQASIKADLDKQQAELRADRRDIALDKLKVLPHFRQYVPDVDPRTTEGAAALEDWAKKHPEAVQKAAAPQPDYVPRAQSKLADIAAGKTNNPLVPIASLRKIMGGN